LQQSVEFTRLRRRGDTPPQAKAAVGETEVHVSPHRRTDTFGRECGSVMVERNRDGERSDLSTAIRAEPMAGNRGRSRGAWPAQSGSEHLSDLDDSWLLSGCGGLTSYIAAHAGEQPDDELLSGAGSCTTAIRLVQRRAARASRRPHRSTGVSPERRRPWSSATCVATWS
jgi:hypothetical protein